MDRFKFRVWRIKENCYNQQEPFPTCCMQENGLLAYFHEERQMLNYIVEQCTGLKDTNGKLIYEGDILKSVFSDEMLYEVIWCADCYKLRVFTKSSRKTLEYLGLKNTKTSYEVIGNIHENKDLLEANNDRY